MEILQYPDPILLSPAEPVGEDDIDDALRATLDEMFDAMYEAKGLGLAAPQVGIGKRLFVARLDPDHPDGLGPRPDADDKESPAAFEWVFINPEITELSADETLGEEGCLSFPGVNGRVVRASSCKVRALDRFGKPFEVEGHGLLARAFQHEIDHLEGKLFIERFTEAQLALYKSALNDLKRNYDKRVREESRQASRQAKIKRKRKKPIRK